MEAVFITVHDLSLDARIKFCSDSIVDILGYSPSEVKGKSCWEYFHPDEIPFAKSIHTDSLDLDKAAVLNYCQMRHKNGNWIGCECVFTVVYDVLVASTSVYKRGPKARRRALEGANVQRIFSSAPKDPRYHMLSFLSNKFYQEPKANWREPRAALFVNRFTRSSSIMFATSSVSTLLGLSPEQLIGRSFYYCITEDCLADAVKCVESAKSNDSIAYLRFRFRDPTLPDAPRPSIPIDDLEDEDDKDSGASLDTGPFVGTAQSGIVAGAPPSRSHTSDSLPRVNGRAMRERVSTNHSLPSIETSARRRHGSLGDSKDVDERAEGAVFDHPVIRRTTSPSTKSSNKRIPPPQGTHIEIEAVVSCSSDSLVVVIRRAHPLVPNSPSGIDDKNDKPEAEAEVQQVHQLERQGTQSQFSNGLFASPWAPRPLLPGNEGQTRAVAGTATEAEAQTETSTHTSSLASRSDSLDSGFMSAIRDVAVFAWSLVGINGNMAEYAKKDGSGKGEPKGEALPPGGLVVWDPNASVSVSDNERNNGFIGSRHRPHEHMGDPDKTPCCSDDEVVWKRAPQMSAWRLPKRVRAHQDALGNEGDGRRKRTGKNQRCKSRC